MIYVHIVTQVHLFIDFTISRLYRVFIFVDTVCDICVEDLFLMILYFQIQSDFSYKLYHG